MSSSIGNETSGGSRSFLETIHNRPLLGDGAMGTQLYAKGVFINKCFEQINLENPALIEAVHKEYLDAGAEIIETNTFGANISRLKAFGLDQKVEEINRSAVEAAHRAVQEFRKTNQRPVWIAASIGPLAENTLPFGRLTKEETQELYRSQVTTLESTGVDLYILETFTHLPQLEAVAELVRSVSQKPIVALLTLRDEGQSSLGETKEKMIESFNRMPADVVGFNCSSGPSIVLELVTQLKSHTQKPWAVFPNAGSPKNVYGRTLYLATPEYFANFAKKFLALGVKIIGGCCGTDASHIRRTQQAILAAPQVKDSTSSIQASLQKIKELRPLSPQRSRLSQQLASKEFVVSVELDPPRGLDTSKVMTAARICAEAGVAFINIADGPRASARMNPTSLGLQFMRELDLEVIIHFCCRDRNLLGLQSDLLGAHHLGIRNILCVTGDPPKLGDYPEATSVFDVDAIGLSSMIRGLNQGQDLAGHRLDTCTDFVQGVGCNPASMNFELEMSRLAEKISAGAEYVMTQPVYEWKTFEKFLTAYQKLPTQIPILIGICPLASLRNAQFLHTEVPGMQIPDSILKRMSARTSPEDQKKEGIDIAREALEHFMKDVQGTYLMPPFNRAETAIAVVEDLVPLKKNTEVDHEHQRLRSKN